ncbi:MAG: DUF2935 domain-containing protein [Tissierellia bacterium]|nr:DUF2935 domain-containing protein [Tissierellia bacterium]
MLSRKAFIQTSLELNLFFQRIMKEHLFFIETNLQPVDDSYIREADILKKSFKDLLGETVVFANCALRESVLKSKELVTNYTLKAEKVTSKLTGASINTNITEAEYELKSNPNFEYTQWLEMKVHDINCRSLNLLDEVIEFKKKLLELFTDCSIFMNIYPDMLDHLVHEAELYRSHLESLVNKTLPKMDLCDELRFWNHIMEDHAQFIDGMLDPTEKDLKKKAEDFAKKFEKLVEESIECHEKKLIEKSKAATEEIRDFKKTATEGLLDCEIKSIIPPLLADHVLREANHYLRILKEMKI